MNAPDLWADFAEVFADVLPTAWTEAEMNRLADEYQREQIANAQSDAAWAANIKEHTK